jgi:nucleoside phosphorylase
MNWLICSAISEELTGLKAFVSKADEEVGLVKGLIGREKVTLASLGIGNVEAAITLSQILGHSDFDCLYFVGTAGILPGGTLEIGEAVQVTWIQPAQVPGERLVGASYENIKCDFRPDEDGVNVWCPQGVSETRELAENASHFAAQVENLELWAVARCARRYELPFGAVLGLSNFTGEKGGEEWLENKDQASLAACQKMAEILKSTSDS